MQNSIPKTIHLHGMDIYPNGEQIRRMMEHVNPSAIAQACDGLASAAMAVDEQDAVIVLQDAGLRLRQLRKPVTVQAGQAGGRIKTTDVMARLSCSDEHIIALKKIGVLTAIRFGKWDTFDVGELDKFIHDMGSLSYRQMINSKLKALQEKTLKRRAKDKKKKGGK